MTVLQDRLAPTIFDADHSEAEERWMMLGMSGAARLLLVVHPHVEIGEDEVPIRLISARRPNIELAKLSGSTARGRWRTNKKKWQWHRRPCRWRKDSAAPAADTGGDAGATFPLHSGRVGRRPDVPRRAPAS